MWKRNPVPALVYYYRKLPTGPLGLTFPYNGWTAINNTCVFISNALRRDYEFNPATIAAEMSDWVSVPQIPNWIPREKFKMYTLPDAEPAQICSGTYVLKY